ncbi:MAG TPA: hypothetical protein VHD15_01050 [Hyphomicrobiales bacterium]|nr:hypothetical protein [Hyphomicrobiales bacterium]
MRTALLAAVEAVSLIVAAPAFAQGLSFPLPGEGAPPSGPTQVEPYRPAVSPFQTESLSEQWNPKTNPIQGRDNRGNCKDAATKQSEQSPTPPTSVACY